MDIFQPRMEPVQGTATPASEYEIEDLLHRGVVEVIPRDEFVRKLASGERMRIYIGADPTRPDLHIGHAVILRSLGRLQKLGHEIVFLIGDFTARIGDPTGKDAARVAMTAAEILKNAETYKEQVQKLIDFSEGSENPARLLFNSEWLAELKFDDVMKLASEFTVQQMLERDMFEQRLEEGRPIYVHEFFYPLMQGYDSVAMNVDVEVGGNDQLFNMLAGRSLLKSATGREKFVLTYELLPGLDGRKMSKSYENYIGIADAPAEMYGKVMAVADELIPTYWRLCTDASAEHVAEVRNAMEHGANPRDEKMKLARTIVEVYHGEAAGAEGEAAFIAQFQRGERPAEISEVSVAGVVAADGSAGLLELIVGSGCAASNGEARRLVEQGGVRLNDERMTDVHARVTVVGGEVLQVGKRKFVRFAV